ncbi:RluA family pseudouridine synthase [Treponema sp. HNW]|uniref:RluA family pseudouridine synthase n=1 Tax=Treponema sp. HNW TaxID=3116654 RepID=UPI003D0E0563
MDFTQFIVQKDDEGRRLDRLVRKFLTEEPLSRIHKSIRSGIIRINGGKKDASFRVSEGERLDIASFLLQKKDANAEKSSSVTDNSAFFTDVFVNEDIRIINKAYGIPVQGGSKGGISVDELIRREYFDACKTGGKTSLSFRPGPLHRIDRRTSGLVCFSQSLRGARLFSEALAHRRIKKEYLALLQGELTETLEAEHFIERGKETKTARAQTAEQSKSRSFKTVRVFTAPSKAAPLDADSPPLKAKKAVSRIEPLAAGFIPEAGLDCTLVRVIIETGRTHQIRAQTAFCGFPLLGDTAYGAKAFRYPDTAGSRELFLHAFSLGFDKDNVLKLPQKISAPLPAFFKGFIKRYLPEADVSTYTVGNETY